ncbi:type II toxin-antitoxin system prevent-host-death family antitoxin [Psychrobacter sp. FBL11]|uniref:Antitoxin n=1 Tax=Psychrobacter saeujeotis TaxID=3143436 RepID=A0ABU9X7F5_9GAMM|nr:type II toxin-antitoxin system prevent-host-death family antitoxin [uncultured Psychrobacter sp.]
MKTFSFAEANQDFKQILDIVNDDTNVVCIKHQNNDDAVVMSHAHYNSLKETLYSLGSPANAAHLAKSIEQYQAGNVSFKALT